MFTRWLYKNYRFSSGLKYWFRKRFTPAGMLVLAAGFLAGGIGIDTNQAVASQVFTLLGALLFVSLVWSLFPPPSFEAMRILPRVGTAGSALTYRVVITNPGRKRQAGLSVHEDLGDPRPTYEEFANTPEPGEEKRNLFDRIFRFYRWMWLVARKQVAATFEIALPSLLPKQETEVRLKIIPRRRGILRFSAVNIAVPDPFGLCRSFSKAAAPQKILILPKRYALPPLTLPGLFQYQPGGVNLASSIGESEEFVALREYRRGDPMRHIHWKSVSKTGKLIVKEFQNEFFVRHALILDTFLRDSAQEALFEEAVSVAASFASALNTQESLLDLLFVGPEAICATAGRGVGHVEHLLEVLAAVQPCTTRTFAALEQIVLEQVALVSACVCVFLGWDKQRRDLVRKIKMIGVPVITIILVEPGQGFEHISKTEGNLSPIHVLELGKVEQGLAKL
jgi:uncharacterized protein (DUF58 family)